MTPKTISTAMFLVGLLLNFTSAQNDVADVPVSQHRLDKKLRYDVIGNPQTQAPPKQGYKVLVVLPGGDGSADFQPFVKRIYQHALDDSYLVVQLMAPKWSKRQRIVWATKNDHLREVKTSTEEFLAEAVNDLRQRTPIDDRHVYALGWSSGGPAVYAASLSENTPLTGAFIAMSVFKPNQLPDLARAKDQAFYLLHSKDDRVCPYRMAESAEKRLSEQGAAVQLTTYPGGHGWQGDVYGHLREGILWLEKQAGPVTKK